MANYTYIGEDLSGNVVEGARRAKDPEDLEATLAEEGLFLKSYNTKSPEFLSTIRGWIGKPEITRLTRQMAVLISSGIPVLDAVESIREQIDDRYLGSVYDSIISCLKSGESLHDSFGKHPAYFDTIYLSLLETGEVSGALDTSLQRIADYRERSEKVSKKIKTAMAYPSLVLLVSIIVIYVLIAHIIPIFSSMYSGFGMELPKLTQKIVFLSEILKGLWWTVPIFLVFAALIFPTILRSDRFNVTAGRLILKIPAVGNLARKLAVARFCRTLGTLLSSGIQLIDAISVASHTVGNRYIEKSLEDLPYRLSEGKPLAQTLSECRVFPKTVICMTSAGESTGRLGEMLTKMADFYEAEIEMEISGLTTLIEPVIIIALGLVIAFILVAMYLPLFDLVGQLEP